MGRALAFGVRGNVLTQCFLAVCILIRPPGIRGPLVMCVRQTRLDRHVLRKMHEGIGGRHQVVGGGMAAHPVIIVFRFERARQLTVAEDPHA